MSEINIFELEDRAHKQGKAGFGAWLKSRGTGEDPVEVERQTNTDRELKILAYSEYVRYNETVPQNNVDAITQGEDMPDKTVTIDQIKELFKEQFTEEREHTKQLVREEVKAGVDEVTNQFQSFIDNNFDPAMQAIDERFEHIDDHLDRLDIEVVTLRTDVRQVKRYLRARSGAELTA